MNTNKKIQEAFNKHITAATLENEFIPKHGVNKATDKEYFKMHGGNFNGQLFDRIQEIKINQRNEAR